MRVQLPFPAGTIIGMVHLQPLPGSPRFGGDLDAVQADALADARALVAGGCLAIMVENFGDAPFHATSVEPVTIAAMSRIVSSVVDEVPIPVGVNVLRNDSATALSIATATGASFIRINVHIGSMMTDQGLIEGKAAETLRLREALRCGPNSESPVAILADVGVKHAFPADPEWMLEREASDCWHRGLADALIVSGAGTGEPTAGVDLARVRAAVPEANIIVGSGVNSDSVAELLGLADAAIVGTALKREGIVEVEAVQILVKASGN